MITLRQHVASLVAVFLALAVGIVLGGGPLAGDDDDTDSARGSAAASGADRPESSAADTTYAEAFAAAGAARLYANGLDTHATAILALPGADDSQVEALNAQVLAAGGSVTGTYTVSDTLLDPEQRDDVEDTTSQLATSLGDPRVPTDTWGYDTVGTLLALAMSTTQPSSVRADLAAVTVRTALADAGLLQSPTDVRNAPLVLVVLPPGQDDGGASLAARTVLAGVVNGVGAQSAGVVVVGDTDSADDGELAALRESDLGERISTVDGTDTALGQVTAVLALIAVINGTSGAFGASGADGAVPLA
ncbi:copper transporter [Nocardioides anomalus]|uniref:Copper transporter n=1 Tax=Nocardioides anomalus TaxID=2712223 RepID=A0A6G6WDI7_9ACTN|nr:copper transporter [Nocardioides anomalus]QIG43411.1 copper transporter [Nocardioides anomalus]